jgi:Ca2+-binding RTX toxin-like protein
LTNIIIITIILLLIPTFFTIQFNYSQEDGNSDNIENIQANSPQIKPQVDVEIEGTANDDKIRGGTGDDKITGEAGYDTLEGGDGKDKIDGGEEDDKIKGGSENDKIEGNQGNDQLEGGEGNDSLKGGKENDEIQGDIGNDKLEGGEGSDSFSCDSFDKLIDFDSQEGDTVSGQCILEDESATNNQENIPS